MPPTEQPPHNNSRLEIVGEIAQLVGDMTVAVAKKVGGDILRVCGLSREESSIPAPMTVEETQKWNVENGFPKNWRL